MNVAANLTRAIVKPAETHRPAIVKPDEFRKVLAAIERCRAQRSFRYSLRILPYVFLRNVELRCGRWEEVDFEGRVWTIPAERMKMRREHVVPLARQVVALLRELREGQGGGELMFSSPQSRPMPISSAGLLDNFRALGFLPEQMCLHGFRSSASTLLNDMECFGPDVIEVQLAHVDKNNVRAAYNRGDYMKQRHEMMQVWTDYIDGLRDEALKGNVHDNPKGMS